MRLLALKYQLFAFKVRLHKRIDHLDVLFPAYFYSFCPLPVDACGMRSTMTVYEDQLTDHTGLWLFVDLLFIGNRFNLAFVLSLRRMCISSLGVKRDMYSGLSLLSFSSSNGRVDLLRLSPPDARRRRSVTAALPRSDTDN
jgi:hypothetical protein